MHLLNPWISCVEATVKIAYNNHQLIKANSVIVQNQYSFLTFMLEWALIKWECRVPFLLPRWLEVIFLSSEGSHGLYKVWGSSVGLHCCFSNLDGFHISQLIANYVSSWPSWMGWWFSPPGWWRVQWARLETETSVCDTRLSCLELPEIIFIQPTTQKWDWDRLLGPQS